MLVSAANEIAKLAKLRDEGNLTQAEFEGEKAKVLAIYDVPSGMKPMPGALGTPAKTPPVSKVWGWVGAAIPLLLIGGCVAPRKRRKR